jgi:dihydrolipoamide dehydrogenase
LTQAFISEKEVEEKKVDIAIIGSGTAGLYALGKIKPSGKSFVLINGGELGTTCARIGCMPSKALIQAASDFSRRKVLGRYGVEGHDGMEIDVNETMEYVQDMRDTFVDRVQSNSTDNMSEDVLIDGFARFIEPNLLEVNGQHIRADRIIIATGSRPVLPEAWKQYGDRIITTDDLFEMEEMPRSLAVIGLGTIGLEIGQSLSRLGVDVTGFDLLESIGGIEDPEVATTALSILRKDFPIHLGAAAEITEEDGKLRVTAGENSVLVEKVLASLGRTPNIEDLAMEYADVELDARGLPIFNPNTMQLGSSHIFIAGDVNGATPLLHEAGDEGRIAGHNAVSEQITPFKRKPHIAINFCDPNICHVGKRWSELDQEQTAVGEVKLAPVGRALIMGKNMGVIRVYADRSSGKLLGASMICAHGENLAHLLAWSIQQGLTVGELIQMPYYHPVIEEALQAALNDLYGKVEAKNPGPIAELEPLA